ncbi:hypothetical protein HZF05_03005 [Sphingomonas sp. CGMCC 1.13654]|uniref:Uncharacterized protein n=1 Tax=Sphingomonas chungangi TaxID=2683589 RepID=A0A838L3T0_9SPHN|nr:hypothetical protein [Sphingomonas chungangi]MBA2933059.1 hypothetical protein [Sphingomonas chungangi]MVW56679.1 hypothetical protein [Sphingomonas chungangi]
MSYWDIGMRHIVDIDGQPLAIDVEVIETTALLARENRPLDRRLWQIRAGEYHPVLPNQLIRLEEDQVTFFETTPLPIVNADQRLAA